MTTKVESPSYLSTKPHNENITNPLLHFHGCIEICQRHDFLQGNSPIWAKELEHQHKLPRPEVPEIPETPEPETPEEIVERMKRSWKSNFEAEMKRIAILRDTISNDEHDKSLVRDLEENREIWRRSPEYKNNIDSVRQWRRDLGKENSIEGPKWMGNIDKYDPDKDISVPVIQFEGRKGITADINNIPLNGKFPNQKTTIDTLLETEPNLSDTFTSLQTI